MTQFVSSVGSKRESVNPSFTIGSRGAGEANEIRQIQNLCFFCFNQGAFLEQCNEVHKNAYLI